MASAQQLLSRRSFPIRKPTFLSGTIYEFDQIAAMLSYNLHTCQEPLPRVIQVHLGIRRWLCATDLEVFGSDDTGRESSQYSQHRELDTGEKSVLTLPFSLDAVGLEKVCSSAVFGTRHCS